MSHKITDNFKKSFIVPEIKIVAKGELMLNEPLYLDCSVNLDPTIVNSIKWKTNNSSKSHKQNNTLEIGFLKEYHHNKNFTCEVEYEILKLRYNSK